MRPSRRIITSVLMVLRAVGSGRDWTATRNTELSLISPAATPPGPVWEE